MAAPFSRPAFFGLHLMEVLNPRAALLSNYEVLQLLKELEADHIARTRTAQRLKKEEDDAAAATGHPPPLNPDPPVTVSENLRTIEVERTINPLACRPPQGIQRLTKSLAPFGLTKAEKLQVVNLTPVEPVELYVVRTSSPSLLRPFIPFSPQIVEELEDRLGNRMEEVLGIVRSSLAAPPPSSSPTAATGADLALPTPAPLEIVDETPARAHDDMTLDGPLWESDVNEVEYMDAGEGVGIEGDLDVEDDGTGRPSPEGRHKTSASDAQ
ncbi:hypothetical protein BC826DRAFT_1102642 [Russula brevipes]|nr:hypothetical protein BC826DRAFT_1102642 [Russula brevipes]